MIVSEYNGWLHELQRPNDFQGGSQRPFVPTFGCLFVRKSTPGGGLVDHQ